MEDEEKIKDELQKISPGFPYNEIKVPAGYFEGLPDQVLDRMQALEKRRPQATWYKWIAIAAVCTGIVLTVFAILPQRETALSPISSLEAYEYIEENIDEFGHLLESEAGLIEDNFMLPEFEVIEEYLMEELGGTDPENYFE